MRFRFAALAAALLVAGCAAPQPMIFDKAGATQADYDRSWARCDYETSAATQGTDYTFGTIIGQELDRAMRKRDLIVKCMGAEGFTLRR